VSARVLLASAGSGKTYQLSQAYLRLVLGGVDPRSIVAATFTRKAAGEILSRVLLRLAQALGDANLRQRLPLEGRPGAGGAEALGEVLLRLCGDPQRLRIGTLDALFAGLARGREEHLGLPLFWSLADEFEAGQRRARALSGLLARQAPAVRLRWLRLAAGSEGSRAVHRELLGSLERLRRIHGECQPDAFGNIEPPRPVPADRTEAARACLERWPTPTSASGKPLRNWRERLSDLRQAVAQGDHRAVLENALVERVASGELRYDRLEIPGELAQALDALARQAAAARARALVERTRAAAELCQAMDRELAERHADRLEHGELAQALLRLGSRAEGELEGWLDCDHLLLDEFQDTSPLQFRLLERDILRAARSERGSLFVVGDPKQSIYRWRDADERLLVELPGRVGARAEPLTENYRSSPAVLELVEGVFGNLRAHPLLRHDQRGPALRRAFERFAGAFGAQVARARETSGELLRGEASVHEVAPDPARDTEGALPPVLRQAVEQAVLLARAEVPSIALLLRAGKHQARVVYELASRGVEASMEGGQPLTDSTAVLALLALLLFADHPGHTLAHFHAASTPWGRAAGLDPAQSERQRLRLALDLRTAIASEGLAEFLERLGRDPRATQGVSHWDRQRLEQLVELARRAEPAGGPRLADFVERVRSTRVERGESQGVRVLTIHGAKGLEFDAVLLPLLGTRWRHRPPDYLARRRANAAGAKLEALMLTPPKALLPFWPALAELEQESFEDDVLEELCTLYVGLTRAVRQLDVFLPQAKAARGGSSPSAETAEEAQAATLGLTSADFVRGALTLAAGGARAGLLWRASRSDERWRENLPRPGAGAGPAPAEAALPPIAPRSASGLSVQSAPAWSGALQRGSARELIGGDARSRQRGSLVHQWLASIDWWKEAPAGPGPRERERLGELSRALGGDAGAAAEWTETLCAALARRPLSELFDAAATRARLACAGGALELWRERAFALDGAQLGRAGELIAGVYDRVVVARDAAGRATAAELLEFKSDRVEGEQAARERSALHREQVESYRLALAYQLELPPERVIGRLVFLHSELVLDL
jgi:ATP-dependent exoDNAse (exonuclease V) beta subunit